MNTLSRIPRVVSINEMLYTVVPESALLLLNCVLIGYIWPENGAEGPPPVAQPGGAQGARAPHRMSGGP